MIRRKVETVSSMLKKSYRKGIRKYLICKECNLNEVLVSLDIGKVICASCVQRLVGAPAGITPKSPEEKFPRGWALKSEYIHTDGRVFERGKDTGRTVQVVTPKPKRKVMKKITGKPAKKRK